MSVTLTASNARPTACWRFARQVDGWLVGIRPHELAEGQDRLAVHGDWQGPMKLVGSLASAAGSANFEERAEFFIGGNGPGSDTFALDEETAAARECLLQELIECGRARSASKADSPDEWLPPTADAVASWLSDAGHEPAIDKQQNLRLTVKRRGCDGQVRIERCPGRLRLSLPLGRWEDLDPKAFEVMHRLTRFANDRCRLARLAWMSDDKAQSCEAQVDLTGLPGVESLEPCMQQLWRDMLRHGVAALELVLRQLGVELPLLAEPRHRALVDLV